MNGSFIRSRSASLRLMAPNRGRPCVKQYVFYPGFPSPYSTTNPSTFKNELLTCPICSLYGHCQFALTQS